MCRSARESLPIVRDERIWFPDMPTMAGVPPLTDFADRVEGDRPRFTPGMRVLARLRWTEVEGRRTRQIEQRRVGEIRYVDIVRGRVVVEVPGWGEWWEMRPEDVEDVAGEPCR